MQGWLKGKLEVLVEWFLEGEGSAVAFEAQYLAYLECLSACWHGPDSAHVMWEKYREWLLERSPQEEPGALSNTVTNRQELVDALLAFRHKFEGPFPKRIGHGFGRLPQPEAQSDCNTRSEGVGLMDFLLGEEE